MRRVQILLADDHEVVRKGLRALLEAHCGWKVIAEATDGREAVEKATGMEISPDPDSPLTPRERKVVQLLAEGKSSKEVAAVLRISVKTAETHRINLMRKLDCHSVAEVVRYAVRNLIAEA